MTARVNRRQRAGRCLRAAAVVAVAAFGTHAATTFALGPKVGVQSSRVQLFAEGAAPAPAPAGSSVALVKVTEESKMTTAGVIGGLAGLLVGGVWVGAGLFAASSYLARREDDDLSKALKGVAAGGLEVLNFGAALNDKYMVTDKLGDAIKGAIDDTAKSNPSSQETVKSISGLVGGAADAVKSLDQDIGIKDTIGALATSATDLAYQAVDKAIEVNKQYKVTDQIVEKIQEATKK